MGITNKMERLFVRLPVIMTALAIVIFALQLLVLILPFVEASRPVTSYQVLGTLAMGIPSSLINPLILIALAALVHKANKVGVIR